MQRRDLLARVSESKAHNSWLATSLPRTLCETVAKRLGVLALLTAATFVVFFFAHTPAGIHHKHWLGLVALVCAICAILSSLAVFVICRRRSNEPRFLLNLAVPYQIAMAVFIGIPDSLQPMADVTYVRGWAGVAAWIFIFAVFVPNTPIRTLWVSSVTAMMDPLTLLVSPALGIQLPSLLLLPQMFTPTVVAVISAVIASRINYNVGQKLHQAREMGSYRLLERLGKGGMGEVWRAEHDLLARPAAIKLIQAEMLVKGEESAETVLLRFEREAQATAALGSEHTVELYDFGIATDGSLYYVMELLDGLDLEELVKSDGPMPPERVVYCLLQVCDSLAEAHENGMVHRDIKPSNIVACHKGLQYDFIKVLDFGLVRAANDSLTKDERLTADRAISGTPAYMVPEIIEASERVDGRADLYALGCVAYWLLSGQLVFEGHTPVVTVLKHLNNKPPPLSQRAKQPIPPALEQLVHACLEKDPDDRPQSARELAQQLADLQLEVEWSQQAAKQWWEGRERRSTTGVDPFDKTQAATAPYLVTPLTVASPSVASLPDTVRERPPKR